MTNNILGSAGPIGHPGPACIETTKGLAWMSMLRDLSDKYDVDVDEIMVGAGDVPPADTSCLVYVKIDCLSRTEYFRKNKSPLGRWVCWNNLEQVRGELSQKGTYNLREGCMYI